MNDDLFFKIIVFILFFMMISVRLYFTIKIKKEGKSAHEVDKSAIINEGILKIILRILLFCILIVLLIFYIINPYWMSYLKLSIPVWIKIIAIIGAIVSFILLIIVHKTLGIYWSTNLQLRENHKLITTGLYKRIRHPMYMAIFLGYLSLSIISSNMIFLILSFVAIIIVSSRVGQEEKMMIDKFGNEYRDYMKRTGLFLPKIRM